MRTGPILALTLAALPALGTASCKSTPAPESNGAAQPAERPRVPRRSRLPGPGGRGAGPGQAELAAAIEAAKAGNLEATVDRSRAAAAANPRLEQAWLLLGSACSMLGNDPCEAAAYRDGLEAIPSSVALQRELGFYLLRQGNVPEGVRRLEQARDSSDPVPASLLADLAVAYKMAGRLEEARATATAAIAADDRCVECRLALGEVAFAEKDFAGAEAAFAAAVERAPDNVEARRSQAKAAYLGGDVDRAAELYARLAERAPDDVRVQVQAGQVLLEAGRAQEAVARLEAATGLVPDQPKLLELLAAAQEAAGDPKAAAATRARAASLVE